MEALKPIDVTCTLCGAQPTEKCRNILNRTSPEVSWVHFARQDAARDTNLPDGITGFTPMPYSTKRWNGAVWRNYQVDEYNHRLRIVERLHRNGHDAQHEIDALYLLANQYDLDSQVRRFQK